MVDVLKDSVLETIKEKHLLDSGDKVIVALSGGPDSVYLLHLLAQFQKEFDIRLYAAHLNHRIRGLEAHKDALFCAALCDKYNIPFFVKSEDVPKFSKTKKMTLEEGAREVRYNMLFELKDALSANKIAVAHNMNDQVETVLMRMMRGTGLYGLRGMDYATNNVIIRPLLDVDKKDILKELEKNNIKWREDKTNEQEDYTRNKIRLTLIPMMEIFSPKVKKNISRLSQYVREDSAYIEENAYISFKENSFVVDEKTIKLDLEGFFQLYPAIQKREIRYAILEVLHSLKGIEATHLEDVIALAHNSKINAQINLPRGLIVYKKIDALYFSTEEFKMEEIVFSYDLPTNDIIAISEIALQAETKIISRDKSLILPTGKYTKAFDLDKIKGNLKVRNRRAGDKIKPMGLGGTKKLKDIFIDEKIPLEERNKIPVICDEDNNILWVVGKYISEDFKIDDTTKNVIRITVKKSEIQ